MAPPGQRIPGMWYPAVDDVMYGPRKRKPTRQETERREQEEQQKNLKKAAAQRRTDANEAKKKARTDANEAKKKATEAKAATAVRPTRKATAKTAAREESAAAREEGAAARKSTKRAAATTKTGCAKKAKVTETCHHSQQVTAILQVQVRLNTDRCQLHQSIHITLGVT